MAIEFVAFAIIALAVLLIIERIYRKVLDNERQIDMQRNKFRILQERLHKQAMFIKNHSQKQAAQKSNPLNQSDVIKCNSCGKLYANTLENCPYCKN